MGLPELSSNAPQPDLPTADRMTEELGLPEPIINDHDLEMARLDLKKIGVAIAEAFANRDAEIEQVKQAWAGTIAAHTAAQARLYIAIREYEIDQCVGEPDCAPGGRWSAEVADLGALVAAAYHDPKYLCLLTANQPAINKLARKDKGLTRIPGVRPIKTVASSRTMGKMDESSEGEKEFDW